MEGSGAPKLLIHPLSVHRVLPELRSKAFSRSIFTSCGSNVWFHLLGQPESLLGLSLGDVASMFVTLLLAGTCSIPLWFCGDASRSASAPDGATLVTISCLNSCVTMMPRPMLSFSPLFPSLGRVLLLSASPLLLLLSPSPSLLCGGKMRSVLPCSLRLSSASTSTRLEAPYGVAALIVLLRVRSLCFDAAVPPDCCNAYSRWSRRRRSWIDNPQPPIFENVSRDSRTDERPSRLFSPGTRAASCRSEGMHEQITRAQISTALQSSGSARSTVAGLDD